MKKDFNVGVPSKENIEFAFKNLLFYVASSKELDIYKEYKEDFAKTLNKVNNVIGIYINNNSLICIAKNYLQDIKYDLIDLDVNTKNLESYFAEWSLLWLDAIISLRQSEIKISGD